MGKIVKQVIVFLRFDFWYVALLVLALTYSLPFLVGMENLSAVASSGIMEKLFTLIGGALFLTLFTPEREETVFQLIKTKKFPIQLLFLMRLVVIILWAFCLLGLHLTMFEQLDSKVNFGRFFLVEMGNILFFAGLLEIAFVLSRQVVVGMLLPLLYYAYCLFVSSAAKTLGPLYLFRFSQYQDSSNWWIMGLLGLGLLLVSIWVRCNRRD